MDCSRREMLLMTALAAAVFTPVGRLLAAQGDAPVDAGEVAQYAKDGVYSEFSRSGFFIIVASGRVAAQSAICTHKRCRLSPGGDGFVCKCHGSAFSQAGKVTHAPAKEDLPRYGVSVNDQKRLLVDLSKLFAPGRFDQPGAFVQVHA